MCDSYEHISIPPSKEAHSLRCRLFCPENYVGFTSSPQKKNTFLQGKGTNFLDLPSASTSVEAEQTGKNLNCWIDEKK